MLINHTQQPFAQSFLPVLPNYDENTNPQLATDDVSDLGVSLADINCTFKSMDVGKLYDLTYATPPTTPRNNDKKLTPLTKTKAKAKTTEAS